MSNGMEDAAREWLAAKDVIVEFLRGVAYAPKDWYEGNAEALIARLAGHKPPMIITFADLEEEPMTELDDLDREIILESLKVLRGQYEYLVESENSDESERELARLKIKFIDRTAARLEKKQ